MDHRPATPIKAVTEARRLHLHGQIEEAESLLLRAGYEEGLDAAAQAEYDRVFPPRPEVVDKMAAFESRLSDPDPRSRVKAARELSRTALRVSHVAIRSWMRHPLTTALLTRHLADDDPIVREEMVIALEQVFQRYFRDKRAYRALLPQLKSNRKLTRYWACGAVQQIGGQECIEHLLPLLQDASSDVRHEAGSRIAGLLLTIPVSKEIRQAVRTALLAVPRDVDAKFRGRVANIMTLVADKSVLAELNEWATKERSKEVKEQLLKSIEKARSS